MTTSLVPASLRGYQRSWLTRDVVAGVTLAAVAIPEVMGYTSIAQTPIVTGLYTVIFPTRLRPAGLVAAARRRCGLGDRGGPRRRAGWPRRRRADAGLPEWVAFCSLTALVCGGAAGAARMLRLGFIGDFLSASVLIGFLTGVGIQVLSGQIPTCSASRRAPGNWFEQQWHWITGSRHLTGDVRVRRRHHRHHPGFKRFLPEVPGAMVAVVAARSSSRR